MITDEAVAQRLIDGKLVRPWTPPAADKYRITAKVQGWWYAGSGSVMYPIRNSRLLSEADAPKSWLDLLDSKWKGKIGTAPITVGGISWMVYAFLTEKFGRDYLLKLLAQDPRMFAGYGHVMLSVERGELLLGTVGALDEYSRRTVERAPIAPIFPTEGVPFANYPMMLMANSPNPNAGELLANWYLSKAGQSNLVRVRGAYPARPDVPGAPLNPPLADLKPWNPGHDFILREHSRLIAEVTKIFGGR
jgi:iron(III) transport system substrate-binding protein